MSTRRLAQASDLTVAAHLAFGGKRRLATVSRLPNSSKKGVYRLVFDDGWSAIAYVWSADENYWPAQAGTSAHRTRSDPFSEDSGIDLFQASAERLSALGVRTPRIYWIDRSKSVYPADIALVEDVPGETLESLLRQDPLSAEPALVKLGAHLTVMHQHRGRRPGRLTLVTDGCADGIPHRSCESIVLDRALADLAAAADRVDRIAEHRSQLDGVVRELAENVRPRCDYGLIHGELGPDHVLLDDAGAPVIIDIEGVMFFDIEWEHVFLRLRFGPFYQWLDSSGLDPARLRFYSLALHLSLVAGPLRLLDGDFPDRDVMLEIVAYNIERTLAFVR